MSTGADTAAIDRAHDVLCPMHMRLDAGGTLRHAGPTLAKLFPGRDLAGQGLFELFEVARPREAGSMAALLNAPGGKLRLHPRVPRGIALKGVIVPWDGGALVNLSFGISVIEAVRAYDLTNTDFAATDMTIEMLYLVEAKSAAMEASRKLNQRLEGAMIAAEEQAVTDTLTGLKNRRALDHIAGRLVERGRDFAVMVVDLDYFKAVNDTLGHAAGDHVLRQVARILVDATREGDTAARVGGDEFVLVFPGLSDRARLAAIARRLIARLSSPIPFEGRTCRISASIGIARSAAYEQPDAARMLADADAALYDSKREGRGRHAFHVPHGDAPRAAGGA